MKKQIKMVTYSLRKKVLQEKTRHLWYLIALILPYIYMFNASRKSKAILGKQM